MIRFLQLELSSSDQRVHGVIGRSPAA